jgi:MrfA Zn-binding domain
MPAVKGAVRRSQLVTTYGVGSIIALGDESFIVTGIDRWGISDANLHEPRLERELTVNGFVVPPATDDGDIPVARFPRWYSCPKCKRLDEHRRLTTFESNVCGDCNRPLVPSRFVMVCPRGHIDDFPYVRWVHEGRPRQGVTHTLFIEAHGATASLRDIEIRCSCGGKRTMDKAFDRFALRDVTRCFGNRPWLGREQEDCDQPVRTLQRGASNVWFGSHRSVISIPPWSDAAFQLLDRHWDILRALPPAALESAIEAIGLTAGTNFTTSDLVDAVRERKRRQEGAEDPTSEAEIRRDEYRALNFGQEDTLGSQFAASEATRSPSLSDVISKVMLVTRLREVRALQGFSRILPPGGSDTLAPLFMTDPGWRPAIEVRGEGLFLVLDEARILAWEQQQNVVERIRDLDQRYAARARRWGQEPDRIITPRLVLIHTFAHALVDQLALDAGYPAASLRERLYIGDNMQGFLIYTASTDAAGSLGGLVAQGEPARLEQAVTSAVVRASWCSADPICVETEAQGADGLNLAACHACALLPETSCEEMNILLDRALMVGAPGDPALGFFADLLA